MRDFQLHPQLINDTVFVTNLKLCQVLLKKDGDNPWLILVPRQNNLTEIIDLNEADQIQLIKEIDMCSRALKKCFAANKLNIGALGNIVSQLHIHIIARYTKDRAWPHTIWGIPAQSEWDVQIEKKWIEQLKTALLVL